MQVALYARVSSDRQDVDLSISAQLKALRDWALQHDHEVVKEFVDEAQSGRTVTRPVFQEMIGLARRKVPPFEAILLWKFSRFARNREDSIIHKSMLNRRGIQVISITEPIEPSPTGRMMEGMLEVLDEYYSANMAQDITRGMRESASRGFWVGSRPPFGYIREKVQDGPRERSRLAVDPVNSHVVVRIFDEALNGHGAKEIASRLNSDGVPSPANRKWGRSAVHHLLTNENYTGTLVWGTHGHFHKAAGLDPVKVADAHTAIVSREDYEQVQQRLRSRSPRRMPPGRVNSRYALSGILKCGHCRKSMFGMGAKSGKYHYYVCATAYREGRASCKGRSVRTEVIEGAIIRLVEEMILTKDNLAEIVRIFNTDQAGAEDRNSSELRNLDLRLKQLRLRLDRLYEALETEQLDITELAPRIRELRAQEEGLLDARVKLDVRIDDRAAEGIELEMVASYVTDLRALLNTGSPTEKRETLASFIKEVVRLDDEAIIEYTIPVPGGSDAGVLDVGVNGGAGGIRTRYLFNAMKRSA